MPLDPAAATTTLTTTTTTSTSSKPISPFPPPHHHQQQQQQTLPIRSRNPQLSKPNEPSSNPFLFPFGRGGGYGALPTAVSGYPPPPILYAREARGGMNLDYLNHALQASRPLSPAQFPHLARVASTNASTAVKGQSKASSRSTVGDVNGHKETSKRERSREDTLIVVKDRKVRITEDDPSLYALCRSWLRNGVNEEIQAQQKDEMIALPEPLPAYMVARCMSNKKDGEEDKDEQEEDEKSVEHLSSQDLLKRHIKRAKKIRALLKEERSQRIARYRTRLKLLLP